MNNTQGCLKPRRQSPRLGRQIEQRMAPCKQPACDAPRETTRMSPSTCNVAHASKAKQLRLDGEKQNTKNTSRHTLT